MQVVASQAAEEDARAFVEEYVASWTGTDEDKILAYYSDNIVLRVPAGTFEGKTAVRDNWVRPFITAFPGNVNVILNLAYGKNLVAMECLLCFMKHRRHYATSQTMPRRYARVASQPVVYAFEASVGLDDEA